MLVAFAWTDCKILRRNGPVAYSYDGETICGGLTTMQTKASEQPMRTALEVASRLRVSRSSVYRMAERGAIPATRIGGVWRFDPDRIDAWLADERNQGGNDD